MDVSNIGSTSGAETVQVYVSAPKLKGLLREKKKLVGFSKVDLAPGETRSVSVDIPFSSLAYYDEETASERILDGKYVFSVGSSSADLPHKVAVKYDSATDIGGNPCFPGWYADPEGIVYGDTVFVYPTRSLPFKEQTAMDCFSTTDLIHWTKHENIISTEDVKWAWGAMWAPAVLEKDGKYYLFFGANDVHEGEIGGIGVAVSDKPAGPFKDLLGRPLINEIVNGAQPNRPVRFQRQGWELLYVLRRLGTLQHGPSRRRFQISCPFPRRLALQRSDSKGLYRRAVHAC